MQKSLLNFFTRSPKPLGDTSNNTQNKEEIKVECVKNETGKTLRVTHIQSDLTPIKHPLKRRRVILESSDEEDLNNELNPTKENEPLVRLDLSNYSCSSPKLSVPSSLSKTTTPLVMPSKELNDSQDVSLIESVMENPVTSWLHLSLPFLEPSKIKDKNGHKIGHPEYDCRTLYVPEEFKSKQTPAMRQWWELKSRFADTILFFKVGKFYELYHMDATVGVEELGLVYMKGNFAHCGFPELGFDRMADRLVRKGYKVARVEQTESVEAMGERCKGRPSSEKVVRREVCQLITPGTCTVNTRSEISEEGPAISTSNEVSDTEEVKDSTEIMSSDSFLLAIIEAPTQEGSHLFGIALLNAAIAKIYMGQFSDDRYCSRLRTLLSHFPPNQVLVERGNYGLAIKLLLKTNLASVPVEQLVTNRQFWTAKDTICAIENAEYFSSKQKYVNSDKESTDKQFCFAEKESWPPALLKMLSEDDPLGRTVKPEWELAFRCLGAVIYYLRYCLIDREVISLGFIEPYFPPDDERCLSYQSMSNQPFYDKQSNMVLDSVTLSNLDIIRNNVDGSQEGTLLERLNSCCSPFGRRLLRQWITAPPCNPKVIRKRQNAVESLIIVNDALSKVRENLRQLPDLERLITKIHLLGSKGADQNHPDSRAIIFDEIHYSRKSIVDFVATLSGFELGSRIMEELRRFELTSPYLKSLITYVNNGGHYPDLSEKITYFKNAFDADKAKHEGRITPEPGIDEDYDKSVKDIERINKDLDDYLLQCSKRLGTRLVFWGTGRNRYQIEVPESVASRVPRDWQLASQRKGVKRYRSSETQEWLNEMTEAEERKDASLRSIMRHIFALFSETFAEWYSAMSCLAKLDCLIALAFYSMNASEITCVPEFIECDSVDQKPYLEIINGFHPCLINTFTGCDIIPNDLHLGSYPYLNKTNSTQTIVSRSPFNNALVVLVTGPNMGGKSTLMRQTALLVILAHLGCRIPAQSCRLTPVDRIFSRLGASDRMLSGESTFLVELSETASILRHISPHSLVLMDELGRGTSTHDGAALAGAVLSYLSKPHGKGFTGFGPRTLFSTHYHNLVDQVSQSNQTSSNEIDQLCTGLGHMACMVDEQSNEESGFENITFLYKFIPGACPKSYGFNAARLALLPDEVTRLGLVKAKEFERTSSTFACLRAMLSGHMKFEDVNMWKSKLEFKC